MRRAFSVAVYARRGDRVLVILHRRLQTWLPVGGELEQDETPLEAAARELREESGLEGRFARLRGACDGVPPGLLGYEEHQAGLKGLHMNFIFVADVDPAAEVSPNHEFGEFRWVDRSEMESLQSPLNVREFGFLALEAVVGASLMARRRQHVNPLGFGFERFRVLDLACPQVDRFEVEVGCADAQFLFERAAREPGTTFVGLEIRDQLVDDVNARAAKQGLPVQALFCHANHHIEEVFPHGRVDRVFVNFPDPWFKRRHHNRRLMDEELARAIDRILSPGGELLFQTDVWGIAIDAMGVIDALDHLFANEAGPWSFWRGPNPYGARSWREQHCEEDGLPIWRLLYQKR